MPIYTLTYQTPTMSVAHTERGLTRAGVDSLQRAILRAGGWGIVTQ